MSRKFLKSLSTSAQPNCRPVIMSTASKQASRQPALTSGPRFVCKVPVGRPYCDHLVEMMVPVENLGTRYLLHTFQGRDSGALYHVVPVKASTNLVLSAGLASVPRGSFEQIRLDQGQVGWLSASE